MTHYISFQQTQSAVYWALAGLLTYYARLLPADRKINTPGSSPGQLLSRIHHDSRQQPEVVSAVPDLVHLPGGDGSPLLVLPESVQLCGVKPARGKNEVGFKVLRLLKHGCRLSASVCDQGGDNFGSQLPLYRHRGKAGWMFCLFILVACGMFYVVWTAEQPFLVNLLKLFSPLTPLSAN